MDGDGMIAIGAAASSLLLFLFIASPMLFPPGSFVHLDGSPTVIEHGWNGISGIGYTLGDILCHQQYGRSFIINGNQMPICIRDTGLLL